jgi:hypothetical protein
VTCVDVALTRTRRRALIFICCIAAARRRKQPDSRRRLQRYRGHSVTCVTHHDQSSESDAWFKAVDVRAGVRGYMQMSGTSLRVA